MAKKWQKVVGGVKNEEKTALLDGEVPFNVVYLCSSYS